MRRIRINSLLCALLCFLVSTAVRAQNYASPSLDADDEVSVFLISPDADATFYMYGYGNGYSENWPGATFTSKGQMADGKYLYKWTRPDNVQGVPGSMIICKNGTEDANKIYADMPFVNHGIFRETEDTKVNNYVAYERTVDAIATGTGDEKAVLNSADEQSVFFESPYNDTYHVWPYIDGDNGGDKFTGTGWPGGALTNLGQLSNGHYLYKWTQPDGIDHSVLPLYIIFNWGDGNNGKQWDQLSFTNHGYYVFHNETVNVDTLQQTGRVYPTTSETSNLDPLATLDDDAEVSFFLESSVDNANYYIWPYTSGGAGGEYYTYNGTRNGSWPGAKFVEVGKLQTGNYLYKWVQNPHITDIPGQFILSTKPTPDAPDDQIVKLTPEDKDPAFENHGYYVLQSNGGTTTLQYQQDVTRRSDGSFATNRTTFGKRVIYEMNIGAFTQEGTLTAAQQQLNYVKELGVDVIWLMPIYERGGSLNSPYAVKDFKKVNPSYGDVNSLKDFVTTAHQLGMDVWLDFVPNHAATDNPWVKSHREYFEKDANDSLVKPNGYGDVYQFDYHYQKDSLDAQGNVVTVTNPISEVMRDVLKYWVEETDIDGYRFDMVSSREIPDAFWKTTTAYLKGIKPSLQFLAEADFSGDDGKFVSSSNFQYDYAWWLNDKLRAWGIDLPNKDNTEPAFRELNKTDNTAEDPKDLAHITNSFLLGSDTEHADRMVYLMNHDKNYGTKADEKYTMRDIWGDNRYAMTVYEFTMPGMPLIYNGQELDGSFTLNYFTDEKIPWRAHEDQHMRGLITELAHLKHTNNALNDGNNSTLRGETRILNSYNHYVLVYERIKGDRHVLVALNFSDKAEDAVVVGATKGKWTRVISGSNAGELDLSEHDETIDDKWNLIGIPAHGYRVFTYTGDTQYNTAGIYFVGDDSWNNPTKHKMVLTGDDDTYNYYRFTINASDFDALNTQEGHDAPDNDVLSFKFQEYYDFVNTVCRKDVYYCVGAGEDNQITKSDTLNFTVETADVKNSFDLHKGGDDVVKYIITFARNKAHSDEGKVYIEIIHANDIQKGYYLLTPVNRGKGTTETHQWRFKDEFEDPDAVGDKYLTSLSGDKVDLCSYTIDASQFDSYIPSDRKAANAIQFRVNYYDGTNDNAKDIDPNKDDASRDMSTFDPRKGDFIYQDCHWDTFTDNPNYFTIVPRQDVDKYIIQLWKTGPLSTDKVRMRVFYKYKYNYQGSTVEDVAASNEDVYLYNVDAQKFLYVGNTWGTMASLLYDDLGTRLNISDGKTGENTNFKTIRTRLAYGNTTETDKNQLGIDDWSYSKTSTDPANRLDNGYIYCDRDNGNRWLFEKADDVDYANTYILRLFDTNDNRFHYMLADHSDGNDEAAKRINTQVKYVAQDTKTMTAAELNTDKAVVYPAILRGGNRINNIGEGKGYISWNYTAEYAGSYDLSIKYMTRANRKLVVNVKDGSGNVLDSYERTAKPTGSYDNVNLSDTMTLRIHLNQGNNVITIGEQTEIAPNISQFTLTMWRPDDIKYGRWQLVTYKDLWNKLKNENANLYGGTTADATFLLKDQGFTRNVPVSWDDDSKEGTTVKLTKTTIGAYADVGMYWNGKIDGKGHIYQDFDVPMYGIYQFDAYGFYTASPTLMYYQYATGKNADGSYVWTTDTIGRTTTLKHVTIPYNGRQTDINTGKMFYQESVLNNTPQYLNTLFISIPDGAYRDDAGNYRLRIGFYKTDDKNTATDKSIDYTAVDDVHLHYNGKATFILDETWDKTVLDSKMTDDRTNVPVWLKRKFYADVWNSLVVPVAVSTSTLRAIFGDNVEVASPYGLDDEDPYTIKFTPIELSSGSIAIEPGKFYIIRPNKLVGTSKVLDMNGSTPVNETVAANDKVTRFYNLGLHDLTDLRNHTKVDTLGVTTVDFQATSKADTAHVHNALNFVGCYTQFHMPDSAYAFTSKGRMIQLINPNGANINGYRFYIIDVKNPNAAKPVTLAIASLDKDRDGILSSYDRNKGNDGETDGIEDVSTTGHSTTRATDGIVYDLSGRRVAVDGNTAGLPKGVYIKNGSKFIKK